MDYNSYIPIQWRVWIHNKKQELVDFLVNHGLLAARNTSEAPTVTTAKREIAEAKDQVTELEIKAENLNNDISGNFGDDDVFRALSGDCISSESGDYTYELCFNSKTVQKPKNGIQTVLGYVSIILLPHVKHSLMVNITHRTFDRLEGNKLYFTQGLKCWNGPHRSTTVEMRCGEKNKLLSVSEPAMCEYMFKIMTPAMCTPPVTADNGKIKDEL